MRHRVLKAALAVLLVLGLSACQATPQSDVVTGKNSGLEAKLLVSAESENTMLSSVPDRWQETLALQDDVQVVIDADIELPSATALPVAEVAPHIFTQEETLFFAKVLMQEQPLYAFSNVRTKAVIETDILLLRLNIETLKKRTDMTDEQRTLYLNDLNAQLSDLEKAYESAPEKEPTGEPVTAEIKPDAQGAFSLDVKADLGKQTHAHLGLYTDGLNTLLSFSNSGGVRYDIPIELRDSYPGGSPVMADALAQAQAFLTEIGVTDAQLVKTEAFASPIKHTNDSAMLADNPDARKCYRFYFCREVGGVPITQTDYFYGPEYSSETHDKTWTPEQLCVWVDSEGIYALLWGGLADTGSVLNDNVATLDFNTVQQTFRQQIFYRGAWHNENTENTKLTIRRIVLGMMRVRLSENRYVYLPVWDFIGDWAYTDVYDGHTWAESDVSLLTLNAVDGSVIDRGLGY